MKIVDTVEYVSVLRDLVNAGNEVNMLIAGNSMSPFLIHQRDYIYMKKPERALRKGDIVFYQRDNGAFIMHRICRVNGDDTFNIVGDAQTIIEKGIRRDQIFARIYSVKRKNKMITSGDFWWDFFEKVWINIIPLRPLLRGMYTPVGKVKSLLCKKK